MQEEKEFHVGQQAIYLPTGKKVLVVDVESSAAPNPVIYCQQTDGDKLIFPVPHRLVPIFLAEYVEEVPQGPKPPRKPETTPHKKLETL